MLVTLLFLTEITLLFLSYRILGKNIFNPAIVMLAVFIVSTAIACLNISNWNITFLPSTLGIMIIGLLCAVLANICCWYLMGKPMRFVKQHISTIDISFTCIFAVVCFELISLYEYFQEILRIATRAGYRPGANLLWHFRNATSYMAEDSLRPMVSLLTKCVIAIGYVFVFIVINNIVAGEQSGAKVIALCLPVLLLVFQVLMGSGRLELLRLCGFGIIVAYILANIKTGWTGQINRKFIICAVIGFPAVFVLFYLATNIIGRKTTRSFWTYISTYAGGSIQHFNEYIQDPSLAKPTRYWGEETFPAVYSFLAKLGIVDYKGTVHLEFRQLGITRGNIYTFFRRPYHDFGLFGMCLLTFTVCLYFSWRYITLQYKKLSTEVNLEIIRYAYLFYWVIFSSIEQYSIGIVSIGTLMTLILFSCVYQVVTHFPKFSAHRAGASCSTVALSFSPLHYLANGLPLRRFTRGKTLRKIQQRGAQSMW